MPNRYTRADHPLILYAEEDQRLFTILNKHLLTLDVSCDETVLSPSYYGLAEQLKQIKEGAVCSQMQKKSERGSAGARASALPQQRRSSTNV